MKRFAFTAAVLGVLLFGAASTTQARPVARAYARAPVPFYGPRVVAPRVYGPRVYYGYGPRVYRPGFYASPYYRAGGPGWYGPRVGLGVY